MEILNKNDLTKYQMYLEYDSTIDDNIMFVQPKPTEYEADFVLNNKYYTSIGSLKQNYDKLMQSATVVNEDKPLALQRQLVTDNLTTIDTHTLTFSPANDAVITYYTAEAGITNTSELTLIEVNTNSIVFETGAGIVEWDITVYGCYWRYCLSESLTTCTIYRITLIDIFLNIPI